MQEVLSNVDTIMFDVEVALEAQLGAQPLPFPGMDKSGSAICVFYLSNQCGKGQQCPFRHVVGEKSIVCKHWLRGLCKKGDQCEFLHEYDLSKMPECYFFSKYNACSNKECPFRHIDPESKIRDCPWYDRGFCRNGPSCKHRHRRRVICLAYLNGVCTDGPNCKHSHPRFDIPTYTMERKPLGQVVCHHCGEPGHKITTCAKLPQGSRGYHGAQGPLPVPTSMNRPLSEVTCYKCGENGHYANRCNKGALAFLSQNTEPIVVEPTVKDENQPSSYNPMVSRRAGEMLR